MDRDKNRPGYLCHQPKLNKKSLCCWKSAWTEAAFRDGEDSSFDVKLNLADKHQDPCQIMQSFGYLTKTKSQSKQGFLIVWKGLTDIVLENACTCTV